MSEWKLIKDEEPPIYVGILLAFEEHWNPVAGFRSGKNEYYETRAHECNAKIAKPLPKWWAKCPSVPHRFAAPIKTTEEAKL